MRDEELFEFLCARWEGTPPDDRIKVFRELCGEIRSAFAGRDGRASFLGQFVLQALDRKAFSDIDDQERRTLLAVAKKAMEDTDEDLDEREDEEEDRHGLNKNELLQRRKEAKTER